MRVIIAGGRDLNDMRLVVAAIAASGWRAEITEVVSGCARGIDTLALYWARANGVEEHKIPAVGPWPAAGPIRNRKMAEYADALIAIPDAPHKRRGTSNMIAEARKRGLRVFVYDSPLSAVPAPEAP